MKNLLGTSLLLSSLTLALGLGGCAAQADESVEQSEDKLIGVLTSPIGVGDDDIAGTWTAVNPADFQGPSPDIQFGNDDGQPYRFGPRACSGAACESKGSWNISDHPVQWFFAGSYVVFHPHSGGEQSLFISRQLNGEILLINLNSWSWSRMAYRNAWRKTPRLTINDL